MNRNETIASIKESLKKLFSATEDVKCSSFVLSDGTKITSTASDLAIGVEVYAIDDMGNQTPMDDGDYVLNDGRTITVEGNKISNIAGETSTEDESPVSDASPKMEKMDDGMAEKPSGEGDLATRVGDLESQIEEILNMLKSLTSSQTQANEQMMSKIKMVADEPGDAAVKPTKKGYEEYNSKKVNQRKNMSEIEELRKLINDKNTRDNNLAL
jgi:hypothetical protein